jgi:hypothetical protein
VSGLYGGNVKCNHQCKCTQKKNRKCNSLCFVMILKYVHRPVKSVGHLLLIHGANYHVPISDVMCWTSWTDGLSSGHDQLVHKCTSSKWRK